MNNELAERLNRLMEERGLQNIMGRLSPESRMVLLLKDVEGRKYGEVAAILEEPVEVVRSWLRLARLELRDVMKQENTGA
jgi:RNA polymerase sigma-70 factor, ECF subfamily